MNSDDQYFAHFKTEAILHAYMKYQELLQAALVFALTKQDVGNVLPRNSGACDWLEKKNVSTYLIYKLCIKHTQTSSSVYVVTGGSYHDTDNKRKWKGEYGANRRKFLADCIESLRQELVRRKYKL